MTKIGHNTSYIQILPYGAATSVDALFLLYLSLGGNSNEKIDFTVFVCLTYAVLDFL